MSSLEPETTARVLLNTTKGLLIVGVWARELPVTSRSFLQKCIDGLYDGKAFTSITEDTVGIRSNSLNQYRDEFHSRVRFSRQGTLGFAKQDGNVPHSSSTDSFFISLKDLPQYNNRYIAFGRLLENSFFTVVSIRDSELGDDGTPLYPVTITSTKVLDPYFDDLVQTRLESVAEPVKKKPKPSKPRIIQRYTEEDDDSDVAGGEPKLKLTSVHADSLIKNIAPKQSESGFTRKNTDATNAPQMVHMERDPAIDSDFDERLDLKSDEESWDPTTLHQHIFSPCVS